MEELLGGYPIVDGKVVGRDMPIEESAKTKKETKVNESNKEGSKESNE